LKTTQHISVVITIYDFSDINSTQLYYFIWFEMEGWFVQCEVQRGWKEP